MPVVQRPAIARSRLDFPVPDSPTISIRSFAPSSNDKFFTSTRPPGKTKKAGGSIQRPLSLFRGTISSKPHRMVCNYWKAFLS